MGPLTYSHGIAYVTFNQDELFKRANFDMGADILSLL